MLKKLLLATAMLLPLGTSAHAGVACGSLPGGVYDCVWDGRVEDDDEILTPSERRQIAAIKDRALKREEAREAAHLAEFKRQRAIEDTRYSQCSVPLLWINCPPRTPEAERYWTNFYSQK
jgi:hypothetical protein